MGERYDMLSYPWKFHGAKSEDGSNNGSIYFEPHPGHAYCLAKAPRYVSEEEWDTFAKFVISSRKLIEDLEKKVAYKDEANEILRKQVLELKGEREEEKLVDELLRDIASRSKKDAGVN
jgi:hypothetical protein